MNNSRQRGLARLNRLAIECEESDDRMGLLRSRFARLADPSSSPRVVSSFNLFPTPQPIADRMAELIGDVAGPILEPSAGTGRLYQAARKVTDAPFTLIDLSSECCGELYRITESDMSTRLFCADFLQTTPESLGQFEAVLMNPPFHRGEDVRHILHALRFLRRGGRMVALCANGSKQTRHLRPEIISRGGTWECLPEGSFRAEGTSVQVALISLKS